MRIVYFGCVFLAFLISSAVNAADIQHWKSERGTPVYFIHAPDIPMVDVRVVFNAGSARDRIAGVASLTNALLDTGANWRNANQIAEDLEQVGAQLSSSSHRDMAVVSLRSLSDESRLNAAMRILTDVVAKPTFPQQDFNREKQRYLLGLKNQEKQPSSQANRAFYKALYGEHPYANMATQSSVNEILRLHVERFHSAYYVANNAVVAIVGDVSRERAEGLANQLLNALPKGKAAPVLSEPAPIVKAHQTTVDLDTQQSHLLLGQLGIERGADDYYDLYVGNHILGGSGFASQLMQVIREDRGLAYSVYSGFSPMQAKGPFVIGMQTKNKNREKALALLNEELASFIEKGPTREAVDKALKNITGSAPMRTDSNGKLVEYLAMIGFYKLPLDYLDTFNDNVSKVTPNSIRKAWQKHITPDKLITVIVGKASEPETKAAPKGESAPAVAE